MLLCLHAEDGHNYVFIVFIWKCREYAYLLLQLPNVFFKIESNISINYGKKYVISCRGMLEIYSIIIL